MAHTITSGQKELLRIIFFRRFGFRVLIVFFAVSSSLSGLLLPYLQKEFSVHLNTSTLIYCVLLSLVYFGFNQLTAYIGQIEAVHAQKELARLIYEQNLRLKPLILQNRSVGEIVSLYTSDVPSVTVWLEQSLPYGFTTLFPLILTPWFLFYYYQLPIELSVTIILILVFLNGALAYRQSLFFLAFKKLAADRMGLVNEWIQNIRGLKILNWIEGFENRIIVKRREETLNRLGMLTNGQVMNSVSSSVTFWINLSVLMFFLWISPRNLTKSDLIGLLWITTVFLSRPLRQLPWFFTFIFDAWTSFHRLADFLDLKNIPEIIRTATTDNPKNIIDITELQLTFGNKQLLHIAKLKVTTPQLIAIVGPVASGKTLLLKSLIKETPFTADSFFTAPTSYVPQEHFVMSASLRDNVNFSYQSPLTEDTLVMETLAKSQFDFKLDRVEKGLDTVVGERGVNLSGGQKQRVSIARQFKNLQDIILLDDPLSAVDVATESDLIKEFVALRNQAHTVILTTQRFSALQFCERVIYLEHGEIIFDGPAELFLTEPRFQTFIKGTF